MKTFNIEVTGAGACIFNADVTCEDATLWQALALLLNHIGIKEENREAQETLRTLYPDLLRKHARAQLFYGLDLAAVPDDVKPESDGAATASEPRSRKFTNDPGGR